MSQVLDMSLLPVSLLHSLTVKKNIVAVKMIFKFIFLMILTRRTFCEEMDVFSSQRNGSGDKVVQVSSPLVPANTRTQATHSKLQLRISINFVKSFYI